MRSLQEGETLEDIAARYGVTVQHIKVGAGSAARAARCSRRALLRDVLVDV